MTQIITNLAPTTETEAINIMLASIGEQPIEDASTNVQADVQTALNLLGDVTRETQTLGWKFNMEFELPLAPAGTVSWVDENSVHTTLNVFTPPTGAVSCMISPRVDQCNVDVTVRPSKQYLPGGSSAQVFYDRARNRDGFAQSERSFLYVDVIWLFNFEQLPQEARQYITVRAARQLAEKALNSEVISKFTEKDENFALRSLRRRHGSRDTFNMLDQVGTYTAARGWRPGHPTGVMTPRRNLRPSF